MSVAYYIVLDTDEPGFDVFVNGKFLAQDADKLDTVCKKLGLSTFDEYAAMSEDDLSDILGEDLELPDGDEEQWFTADEGIRFVTSLMSYLKANPAAINNPEGVLADLAEYETIFEKTKQIDAKWHLNIDI